MPSCDIPVINIIPIMDIDLPYKIIEVAELPGHDDRTWHIAWNPTKPLLASCSADKSVRLFSYSGSSTDLKFSNVATISTGHTKTVRAIAWAPSGDTLATASFDSNVGIWEREAEAEDDDESGVKTGEWECVGTVEGHETECKSVAYSCTGTLLATCSRDKTVWIWEVAPDAEFECMAVLMEHTEDVKYVAWHPTEEILASASYDDTIKLYIDDPSDDWFCFTTLKGHSSTVWCVAWSPVGSYLASASDDRTVRIWQRVAEHKWECVLILVGHERSIYSISWGIGKNSEVPGNLGWVATTGGDGSVRVWEISETSKTEASPSNILPPNHKLIANLTSAHGVHDVNSVVWCPRAGYEDLLATAGDDGSTRVWKITTT